LALPAGFLWCNGQAVSRTTYAAEFAAIATAFDAGDGASTFNPPDLRDRVRIGQGAMGGTSAPRRVTNTGTCNPALNTGTIGNAGGVNRHTLPAAQVPAQTHTMTAPQGFRELAGALGSAVVAQIATSRTTSCAGGGKASNKPTAVQLARLLQRRRHIQGMARRRDSGRTGGGKSITTSRSLIFSMSIVNAVSFTILTAMFAARLRALNYISFLLRRNA
jgi:microcystin-dependent protein